MSAAADDEKAAFDESCAAVRELSHTGLNPERAIANKQRTMIERG
jgi:hypothetical protein